VKDGQLVLVGLFADDVGNAVFWLGHRIPSITQSGIKLSLPEDST
jgi:hypothetical protein